MAARKRRWWRRLLGALALMVLLLIVAAVTLPWWLPGLLRVVGPRFNWTFDSYERLGYRQLALNDVKFETPGVVIRAARVETASPLFLLRGANSIRITDWQFTGRPQPPRPRPAHLVVPDSTADVLDELIKQIGIWKPWVADAELRNGRVEVGENRYGVPLATWSNETLRATIQAEKLRQTFEVGVATHTREIVVAAKPLGAELRARLQRQPHGWHVAGTLDWEGNTARFEQRFDREHWWPVSASVVAADITLPGRGIKGALAADWDGEQYRVELAAESDPFHAVLAARGDTNSVLIEKFALDAPGVQATLTENVRVALHPLAFSPAVLRVAANLPQSPIGPVTGAVRFDSQMAHVELTGTNGFLRAQYDFASRVHSGQVAITELRWPNVRPLQVTGTWTGEGTNAVRADVTASAGQAELRASGLLHRGSVALSALTLRRAGVAAYELTEPSMITVTGNWVRVENFRWAGRDGAMAVDGAMQWPQFGRWQASWRSVDCRAFCDFLTLPLEELWVTAMDLEAQWENGPVELTLALSGKVAPTNGTPLQIESRLRGGAGRMQVNATVHAGQVAPVLTLAGTLPLEVRPARQPLPLAVVREQPVNLTLRVTADEGLWRRVATATGVLLRDPSLRVDINGPIQAPAGELTLRASAAEFVEAAEQSLPAVTRVAADVRLSQLGMELEQLAFDVERQPVRLHGNLPISEAEWTALLDTGQLPDWRKASGKLRVVDAELAPFARFWRSVFAPEGRLEVDLRMKPGVELEGGLQLTGAATRPLPPVGPIDQIQTRILFRGRVAVIEEFSGRLGGEPVKVTGQINIPTRARARADLRLAGKNVPIVREPGMLVRADANIWFRQGPDEPATLSGDLVLRDSLFLRELKVLAPGQLTQVRRRPPYFSVENPPFADWRLDLRLRGNRFLQVRSPVFRGEVSAAFDLSGTLREPLATGSVQIDSGTVKFPFTDFKIDQGTVSLSSEDPYQPRLSVTASARSFGYDLRMELTGTANAPLLAFSATPPLSSEEVLMMVTAGQLPQAKYEFTTGEKASRLALFLGRDLLRKFGAEGAATDRLTIRSGEDVTEQGALTYYIEYRLSDRWSVFGEQDRFDQLNVGVRWRVFSR